MHQVVTAITVTSAVIDSHDIEKQVGLALERLDASLDGYLNRESSGKQLTKRHVRHETHTMSIEYYDLGTRIANGGFIESRTASTSSGYSGSSIMATFDDAIGDGLDALSLSLTSYAFVRMGLSSDPIENDMPTSSTVLKHCSMDSIVAATTIVCDLEDDVVLVSVMLQTRDKVIKVNALHNSLLN
ncbi:hypothetical protein C5167_023385 [Papaver somniferum]|uniref:Uncharacterized protein n=1 Tax=Papaver somniferum TaxID=3469 RepID=A0A4Y7JP88_PAPSO|nr:hypothetical protein C5167_023385 [Papaver somniferum]